MASTQEQKTTEDHRWNRNTDIELHNKIAEAGFLNIVNKADLYL